MSCSLPLTFKLTPPPPQLHRQSPFLSDPNKLSHSLSKSFFCFAFSSSDANSSSRSSSFHEREESRWLREEQRWLREEQRWLREEQRWNAERDTLLLEIKTLELRIQELQGQNSRQQASLAEAVANIAKLLQVLKEGELGKNINRIAESGSSAIPLVVEAAMKEEEVVVKEVVNILDTQVKEEEKKRKPLRKGSEGSDVRAMQEALQKLGFYSGEEDMEFSAFDSGTERAVKTWQATIGMTEDGVMTSELLERLFMEQKEGDSGLSTQKTPETEVTRVPEKKPSNGAPHATIPEIQKKVVKDEGKEVGVSEHRVFLLGENRWEEPSRLSGHKKQVVSKSGSSSSATKCLTCHGEGRLLCMECDGTGEPNIEPQFMEWVDEGTKCPYCEGNGYTICDVCKGKKVVGA